MKPILFENSATTFNNNGLGALVDAVSCSVTEERNGSYELRMDYPTTGNHYADLQNQRIIYAKPNAKDGAQPFRIYQISRPMGGIVTVSAQHISYDLSGIPCEPFTAGTVSEAMLRLEANAQQRFTFWTNKATTATMKVEQPSSIRSLLAGQRGSVLDVYGGDWGFDGFTAKLYESRGADNGVQVRYGKNLTDLKQEENVAAVYNGVFPFWYDEEQGLVEISGKIIRITGAVTGRDNIMMLDLTSAFEEKPTAAQLQAKAQAYINSHSIGVPEVNLTVSFAQLASTEEYKGKALLEQVDLCDTVTVIFPELGVNASAKCVKTVYDVLLERYTSVELGTLKNNIADTIASAPTAETIRQEFAVNKAAIIAAAERASLEITGNLGGFVVMRDSDADGEPDEILVMDTNSIETATKVWRWNKNGLGYSSTGYNGTYGTAITANGQIVADYITTGTMTAERIKGGILQDNAGKNYINLTTGKVVLSSDDLTIASGVTLTNALDDIETAAGNAQTTANGAVTTANAASTAASGAVSTANAASTAASNAQSTANTASTNASNAVSTANTANSTANTAKSTADTAKSTADTAKSTADSAKTTANSALTQAQQAYQTANTKNASFNGAYVPTNSNYPASGWTTKEVRQTHINDTFYNTVEEKWYSYLPIEGVASTTNMVALNNYVVAESEANKGGVWICATGDQFEKKTYIDVYNKLTSGGTKQGIYAESGNYYINANYIHAGTIDASVVNVTNLNATNIKTGTLSADFIRGGKLASADGSIEISLGENKLSTVGTYTIAEDGTDGGTVYTTHDTKTDISTGDVRISDIRDKTLTHNSGKEVLIRPDGIYFGDWNKTTQSFDYDEFTKSGKTKEFMYSRLGLRTQTAEVWEIMPILAADSPIREPSISLTTQVGNSATPTKIATASLYWYQSSGRYYLCGTGYSEEPYS